MRARFLCLASLVCLTGVQALTAQNAPTQPAAPQSAAERAAPGADGKIHLDLSVHSGAGQPVPALREQDVTVLDNGTAQRLSSFKAVPAGQGTAEIIFLMDAANVQHVNLSRQQEELQGYLRSVGKLPHPATIAVLTDKGVKIQKGFSSDGPELSKLLDGYIADLRVIGRSAGYWGETERLDLSLKAMSQLVAYAETLPGRKFLIWISPGWPLLSGPRMELDNKQQASLFHEIVSFSNELRAARVTVYDVNPFGLNQSLMSANYYRTFVKGVRKAKETEIGDLGLQVMAVQSGGQTLTTNNDITAGLRECVAETESWYEISFPMPPAEGANEYHHVEVRLTGDAKLTARTRDGYYAQPAPTP